MQPSLATHRHSPSVAHRPAETGDLVIACDEHGAPLGRYLPKGDAHDGDGVRHLAIAVLLYSRTGQVLLQLRRHALFDGIWDLTGATHPLFDAEHGSETIEDAARRCLAREYGIADANPRKVGAFTYAARDGASSENEYCVLLIGEHNGPLQLNREVAYGCAWITWEAFLSTTTRTPNMYTPWAVRAAQVLRDAELLAPPATTGADGLVDRGGLVDCRP